MDRISLVTPRTDLTQEPTTARPTPRSGTTFKDVVSRSAGSLVDEARSMMLKLPGGPVLAAAVRGAPTSSTAMSAPLGGHSPGGARSIHDPVAPGGLSGPSQPGGGSGPAQTTGGTAAEGPGAPPVEGSGPGLEGTLQSSQDMNLYYLQLQEAMAAENRAYSASSNVLKARHDTVKNAIGNIR